MTPADQATGVSGGTTITIVFGQKLDQSTVTPQSVAARFFCLGAGGKTRMYARPTLRLDALCGYRGLQGESWHENPNCLAQNHKSVVTFECYWHVASCIQLAALVWLAGRPLVTPKRCALAVRPYSLTPSRKHVV